MRNLLIAIALLFSTTVAHATPEWKQKPVQCADTKEIFDAYIIPGDMKPMFIAVANIMTVDMQQMPAPVVFYLGETGQWMLLELGGDYSCVISLGDGWDPNIDPAMINDLILGGKTT